MLHSPDETEHLVARAVAELVVKRREEERAALAIQIVNTLAEALNS